MTEQYLQGAIQQRPVTPINIQTPDATPVIVTLDVLTQDVTSAVVTIAGGGSDPAAPNTNNYVTFGQVIYERTTLVSLGSNTLTAGISVTGAAVTVVPLADGTAANRMLIEITGPAFPYNHRLLATVVLLG